MSDLQEALDTLRRFNAFISQDSALSALLLDGEYNFLQSHQLPLFLGLMSSKGIEYAAGLDGGTVSAPALMVRSRQILGLGITLASYLFLVLTRRRVLVFAADKHTAAQYVCDFRMENLYRGLFLRNTRFIEVLHTLYAPGFVLDALKRCRPALYLESFDLLHRLAISLGLARVGGLPKGINFAAAGGEAELFRGLAQQMVRWSERSRFRIAFFKRMLRFTGVHILIATSDTRNYNELVAACRELGIKTYGFQSGNLNKYDVGYLDYGAVRGRLMKPDVFFTETEYWRGELLRLGTYFSESELRVGGNMKEDYHANLPEEPKNAGENISVLIPYEILAPKEEVLAFIRACARDSRIIVVFKFRGDRDLAAQVREYGLGEAEQNLRLITDLSEIESFDVVAGTYSTFLYEMIGQFKPVGFVPSSVDLGEGLVRNGLVNQVSLNAALYEQLDALRRLPRFERIVRCRRLYGDAVPLSETLAAILP